MVAVLLAGWVVYALASVVFLGSANFTTPGSDNRTANAAALGAVMIGMASRFVSKPRAIKAVLCFRLSGFWKDAAQAQREVLRSVQIHLPALPRKTVLLLDGFCPYRGPGTVFEPGGT